MPNDFLFNYYLQQAKDGVDVVAETATASNSSAHWLDLPEHSQLKTALEDAVSARRLIKPEQERLRELLAEAKTDNEREAREYQIWYIEVYLNRAADIAEKRIAYFQTLKTQEDFDRENEKCAADKIYWFEYYAFGYDPRARTPISIIPFELYPKQAELVDWLDETVFHRRTSGIVEKSRDEGATELFVRWSIHNWRYTNSFSVLLSTRKEDEIDTKKKQGTLFERARMQIRLLPTWMLPKDFDIVKGLLPDKLIVNPENKNAIQGEAPVERMGSGDRVTCALFDEHAFWRFSGYPQYASMSQTTDSILSISSVGGKLNMFADIAFDGVTRKFVLDWKENPLKTQAWYNSLLYGYIAPKMSKTTIAQEVDRNYDASQPGKVFHYKEEYIFITQSEFLKPFIKAKMEHRFFDEQGKFRIPPDWRIMETSDYGQTVGHEWSYGLFAQPTANYPLNDTHFCFWNQNLVPTGLTTEQAVESWRQVQCEYGLRVKNANYDWINKPAASWVSHEQDGRKIAAGEESGLRTVLREKYGEIWRAWIPDYNTGIDKINEWFTPIDKEEPNPFRDELRGRCTFIFVAPDGEYKMAYNERESTHFVTVSASEKGFFTARKQLSAYHYPTSELGKAVKAMRPAKMEDDIIDNFRGYAVMWNKNPVAKTPEQEIESRLPEHLKQHAVAEKYGTPEFADALTAKQAEQGRIRADMTQEQKQKDKKIQQIFGGSRSRLLGNRRR